MVETIGFLAAALTTCSFVPQVIQVMRTREVSGISIPMYAMFVVGIACWLWYGVLIGSAPVTASNAVTLLLAGCVLILTIALRARR